jgi:hypothetical protein
MSKPSHTAYVVAETREGAQKKAFWREVGSVWPHKNGAGFDLVIFDQLAVSGRIVCTERKEKPPTSEQAETAQAD